MKKLSFLICCLFLSACANYLSKEEVYNPSDIPVSLSTRLQQNISGVTNINFEENDAIGFYMMVQPSTIEKSRYIDNMKFTYTANSDFMPEETVYFPEGKNTCDFICYYPYQKNAVSKGKSIINIGVQSNQTSLKALSSSDFLVAKQTGISSSNKPIDLPFEHKFSQLNISLKPKSGYTVETLLNANPTIKVKNIYTKASYDFATDKFTNLNAKTDITPYGTWYINNDTLCGKSMLIIPQTLSTSHIFLELYIEDRVFECTLADAHTFTGGIAEEYTITLLSSEDATKTTLSTRIQEWQIQEKELNAKEVSTTIYLPKLTFEESNVYKVMNKEKQIAEICLEYLLADNINARAVVVYPITNGKTDLKNGLVAEIKNEPNRKHGGSVSWNIANNSLTYVEGDDTPIEYIYISDAGEIRTSRPEKALQLQLSPDLLIDNRNMETISYPIAKIASQYWIRSNFKATQYTNGSSIEKGETVSSTPQYYTPNNTYFFYNAATVATGLLIPNGWRVCNETDVNKLKSYIKGDASVLKNGQTWSNVNFPITNLSGLNIAATGFYNKTYTSNRTCATIWYANNSKPNLVEKSFTLSTANNSIELSPATTDMALTVRCIRD